MKQPIVNCPQCGKTVVWDSENPYRPFCSERCKLIDLGQWAAESYRIPDDGKQEDEPAGKEREEGAK
ncbi:MAG TPA: DNA gyrase inhibitor YacG [Nitrosospira sp.]|nr:DNA gyrase inhibitor YacG [Nitrosospira sp.]